MCLAPDVPAPPPVIVQQPRPPAPKAEKSQAAPIIGDEGKLAATNKDDAAARRRTGIQSLIVDLKTPSPGGSGLNLPGA